MAVVSLSPIFNAAQQFTAGGIPLAAGLLNTYQAGTITPALTYTTNVGDVANSNPIQLGTDGRPPFEIWLIEGQAYKFILTDSLGANPLSFDNIIAPGAQSAFSYAIAYAAGTIGKWLQDLATSAGSSLIGFSNAGAYGASTVGKALQDRAVSVTDAPYLADSTGVVDASTAFQTALSSFKNVVIPPGTYKIGTSLTMIDGQTLTGFGRPQLVAVTAGQHILSASAKNNVSVLGVRFKGLNSGTAPLSSIGGFSSTSTGLLTIVAGSDVRVESCEFDTFYNGCSVINCDRVWVEKNRITNWLVYGVLASLSKRFTIDRNDIKGCNQAGAVNAYGISATGDESGANIQIVNSISFNDIAGVPSWDGIMTHDVSGLRVIGNDIRDVRIGLDIGHVVLTNFVRDVVVALNYIESTATNTWGATPALHGGIQVTGFDGTHQVDGLTVLGNEVKNFFTTAGMVLSGNAANIAVGYTNRAVVSGNRVRNTGTINAAPGLYVIGQNDGIAITGNSFEGSMSPGAIRFASVIADSATIVGNTIKQTTTTDPAIQITGSTITSLAMDANAHNSTVPFVQSTSTLTQANSGVFTATLTGCATSPTANCQWAINGNMVTLTIPSLSAVSNTTACTLTGLPAFLQPFANSVSCAITAQDNGAFTNNITAGITAGSGTITLQRAGSSTGWTNVGTKGPFGSTVTYALN